MVMEEKCQISLISNHLPAYWGYEKDNPANLALHFIN
jgi:hypothetical protein